ncbi:MAG: rRNA pseudouridine synthase [Deltaproteobacteria bacterium]|nr:rRNA pseudouridine synthase [Deltaproteobacteria bacterium]
MEERLQKLLAGAGVASRRAAEKMIAEGRIRVNGIVVTEPGTKADPGRDEIRVDGKLISFEMERVYILLHKPQGYVTTLHDPQGRPIVTDLLSGVAERVYPVGRLDYDSEGLIILTNDGEFSQRLQHPRHEIPKTYRVKVEGNPGRAEIQMLEKGFDLPDGRFAPVDVQVEKTNRASTWLRLTISEGRNRVVRRAFEALGHPVRRLVRIAIGDVTLDGVREGDWRILTPKEVDRLLTRAASDQSKKKGLDIHLKIMNSRRK